MLEKRRKKSMLQKIESIPVDQGFWGRMLDYGTVTVRGTGGTFEPFPYVAHAAGTSAAGAGADCGAARWSAVRPHRIINIGGFQRQPAGRFILDKPGCKPHLYWLCPSRRMLPEAASR